MPMLNVRIMSSAGTLPLFCSHRKSGGSSHDGGVDDRRGAVRQHARQVVGDPAAGDVRHRLDAAAVEQRTDHRQVRAVRLEQRVADGAAELRHMTIDPQAQMLEHDPARQRVAVGVQPGRRNADQHVADGHRPAVDQAAPGRRRRR